MLASLTSIIYISKRSNFSPLKAPSELGPSLAESFPPYALPLISIICPTACNVNPLLLAHHQVLFRRPLSFAQNFSSSPLFHSPITTMAIPATSADGTHHQYTLAFDLPPVSDLRKIFKDLAEKALKEGLQSALDAFGGRCISIATMCSGTEAPIIATRMASEGMSSKLFAIPLPHVLFGNRRVYNSSTKWS